MIDCKFNWMAIAIFVSGVEGLRGVVWLLVIRWLRDRKGGSLYVMM